MNYRSQFEYSFNFNTMNSIKIKHNSNLTFFIHFQRMIFLIDEYREVKLEAKIDDIVLSIKHRLNKKKILSSLFRK
jgi:hypothetical protein